MQPSPFNTKLTVNLYLYAAEKINVTFRAYCLVKVNNTCIYRVVEMNVALNRPSAQSSLYAGGASSRALDGNINPSYQKGISFFFFFFL